MFSKNGLYTHLSYILTEPLLELVPGDHIAVGGNIEMRGQKREDGGYNNFTNFIVRSVTRTDVLAVPRIVPVPITPRQADAENTRRTASCRRAVAQEVPEDAVPRPGIRAHAAR